MRVVVLLLTASANGAAAGLNIGTGIIGPTMPINFAMAGVSIPLAIYLTWLAIREASK